MEITVTLEEELREAIEGEVRFDVFTRKIYSTDASMYEIEPGPRVAENECRRAKYASNRPKTQRRHPPPGRRHQPRRPAVGEALVLDFSKYMNRVIELNADEEWARVQPGWCRIISTIS